MSMNEDEARDFAISLLNPRTARDAQREVGASNLSNPCDRCRAHEINGTERSDPIMDGAWGGRVLGTAFHAYGQSNIETAIATADLAGDDLAQIGARFPGLETELHLTLGELLPGRLVTSTTDLYIPTKRVVWDWKGTDLRKLTYLRDAIAMMRGTGAIFGRDSDYVLVYEQGVVKSGAKKGETVFRKAVKGVSERVYADEIAHAQYKIVRYSNQLHHYGRALVEAGKPVEQAYLCFVARDSAMTVDNRDSVRYLDESAPRGVVAIAFAYNHDYAVGLWKNAQAMAKALDEGTKAPEDYPSHPMCGVCAAEDKREDRASVIVEATGPVDPWAAMVAA